MRPESKKQFKQSFDHSLTLLHWASCSAVGQDVLRRTIWHISHLHSLDKIHVNVRMDSFSPEEGCYNNCYHHTPQSVCRRISGHNPESQQCLHDSCLVTNSSQSSPHASGFGGLELTFNYKRFWLVIILKKKINIWLLISGYFYS